jgi:hypothetical protein
MNNDKNPQFCRPAGRGHHGTPESLVAERMQTLRCQPSLAHEGAPEDEAVARHGEYDAFKLQNHRQGTLELHGLGIAILIRFLAQYGQGEFASNLARTQANSGVTLILHEFQCADLNGKGGRRARRSPARPVLYMFHFVGVGAGFIGVAGITDKNVGRRF